VKICQRTAREYGSGPGRTRPAAKRTRFAVCSLPLQARRILCRAWISLLGRGGNMGFAIPLRRRALAALLAVLAIAGPSAISAQVETIDPNSAIDGDLYSPPPVSVASAELPAQPAVTNG